MYYNKIINWTSVAFGIAGCILDAVSFWRFGWLSIIGIGCGLMGVFAPTKTIGYKYCAIIAVVAGAISLILTIITLCMPQGY